LWKTLVDTKNEKRSKNERTLGPDGNVENLFLLGSLFLCCKGFPLSHRPDYDDDTMKPILLKTGQIT
jgi:hypothetical protein